MFLESKNIPQIRNRFGNAVNQRHGLRRTNDDKRRAVEAALKHEYANKMSNREIARHCGVSYQTVNNYRNEIASDKLCQIDERTATRNGKQYTINTANIGKRTNTEPSAPPGCRDFETVSKTK